MMLPVMCGLSSKCNALSSNPVNISDPKDSRHHRWSIFVGGRSLRGQDIFHSKERQKWSSCAVASSRPSLSCAIFTTDTDLFCPCSCPASNTTWATIVSTSTIQVPEGKTATPLLFYNIYKPQTVILGEPATQWLTDGLATVRTLTIKIHRHIGVDSVKTKRLQILA